MLGCCDLFVLTAILDPDFSKFRRDFFSFFPRHDRDFIHFLLYHDEQTSLIKIRGISHRIRWIQKIKFLFKLFL